MPADPAKLKLALRVRDDAETERFEQHLRRAELIRAFETAANDPLFLLDITETAEAFTEADAESARMLPKD